MSGRAIAPAPLATQPLAVPGRGILQRRLAVGSASDPLEQEAERRAAEIVASAGPQPQAARPALGGPTLRRTCARCEEEEETTLRRHAVGTAPAVAPPSVSQALAQSGTPLSDSIRGFMEPRFAADFGGVRIHTNLAAAHSAAAVNARAYTVGQDIVFAAGAYSPDTRSGRTLIAHELTHVLQQRYGAPAMQRDAAPGAGPRTATADLSAGALDVAFTALRTASVLVPGLAPLVAGSELIRSVVYFWNHRDEHLRMLLDSIGTAVGTVPGLARARMNEFLAAAGTGVDVVACVGGELIGILESLAANWRGVLESFVRDIFFVGLFQRSLPSIIDNIGGLVSDLASGEFRSAVDRGVAIMTEINAIAGVLYLWFALITTVVGTVAGSEVPVAGNAVGGAAGLTVAQVVNIGLLASVVATETARVGRGIDDMVRFWDDVAARESGCRQVAEGVFALALTAALFFLGPGIQRVARSIIAGAARLVRSAATATSAALRDAAVAVRPLIPSPGFATPGGTVMPFASPEPVLPPTRPPVRMPPRTPTRTPTRTPPARTPVATGTTGPATTPSTSPQAQPQPLIGTATTPMTQDPLRRQRCTDGTRRDCPLPFIWYKPIELYAPVIDMPNAVPPGSLDINRGPTTVGYRYRRRTVYERFGISNWPAVGRTFQFIPYDARVTPEQARFNDVMDTVGFDRSGFDAEHVWDVYLRGLEFDRFTNLWPASNQEQQLAGTRHRNQIVAYQAQYGNVNGRWFEIVEFRHPAEPP